MLCDAGTGPLLYSRKPELAKAIAAQHENQDYLRVALTPALDATPDPAEALSGCASLIAFAVPAQSLRANLTDLARLLPPGALLVSLMKGVDTHLQQDDEGHRQGDQRYPGADERGGRANLAGGVDRRQFTTTVVACSAPEVLALQARAIRRTSGPTRTPT